MLMTTGSGVRAEALNVFSLFLFLVDIHVLSGDRQPEALPSCYINSVVRDCVCRHLMDLIFLHSKADELAFFTADIVDSA